MKIAEIDPRDACAEVDDPVYRIELISRGGGRIDTLRVTGAADVEEVLRLAESRRGDGVGIVWVEADDDVSGGVVLHRVYGSPDHPDPGSSSAAEASG